jgi:hypothetical protein
MQEAVQGIRETNFSILLVTYVFRVFLSFKGYFKAFKRVNISKCMVGEQWFLAIKKSSLLTASENYQNVDFVLFQRMVTALFLNWRFANKLRKNFLTKF